MKAPSLSLWSSTKGFLLFILLFQAQLADAQVSKCIQPDGVVLYTDQGCSSGQISQAAAQDVEKSWLNADLNNLSALWREKSQPLLLHAGSRQALILLYLIMSTVCFIAYYRDKKRAIQGVQRTPEVRLHFYELLGGWPGGLLAQRMIRHKNRKKSYQQVFWLIVLLNLCATGYFLATR